MRIYYLASGAIAVPALEALAGTAGLVLAGCGTQPDRPSGRQRQLTPTPVAAWCAAQGLAVDQPLTVKEPTYGERLARLNLDFLIVFAFGQLLPSALLRVARWGAVNVHASLLPRHRGAAPINAALAAGDLETGLSIMAMDAGLDTGPVYRQFRIELGGREYAPQLAQRLGALAAAELAGTLRQIAAGELVARPQAETGVSYAPKLKKCDGQIRWTMAATAIEQRVRAYHPWPGAWFWLRTPKRTRQLTITAAAVSTGAPGQPPGTVLEAGKRGWLVACGEGALRIDSLIPEGKQEMSGAAFLRGCPLPAGSIL